MKFIDRYDPILREIMPTYGGDYMALRPVIMEMWKMMRDNRIENYDTTAQMRVVGENLSSFRDQISNGVGIAAPQVGVRLRAFVMQLAPGRFNEARVCINPTVERHNAASSKIGREGCLSCPGLWVPITRPESIVAGWTNLKGHTQQQTMYGMAARVFQHELDHLNGITIWPMVHP